MQGQEWQGELISARFSKEDAALIRKVVGLRKEGISSFLRRAVMMELARLGYVDPEHLKAFGLAHGGGES